jgi:hypothetical protein
LLSKVFDKFYLPQTSYHNRKATNFAQPPIWLSPTSPNNPKTHRIVDKINEALDTKQYCSAAFLAQAFDKVWHTGLLYKLLQSLLLKYFLLLKSYLTNRHFRVKVDNEFSDFLPVNAGVPQGSVLGPILYLLYTSDLPYSPNTTTATFANDAAVLALDSNPTIASQKLQNSLDAINNGFPNGDYKQIELNRPHLRLT